MKGFGVGVAAIGSTFSFCARKFFNRLSLVRGWSFACVHMLRVGYILKFVPKVVFKLTFDRVKNADEVNEPYLEIDYFSSIINFYLKNFLELIMTKDSQFSHFYFIR